MLNLPPLAVVAAFRAPLASKFRVPTGTAGTLTEARIALSTRSGVLPAIRAASPPAATIGRLGGGIGAGRTGGAGDDAGGRGGIGATGPPQSSPPPAARLWLPHPRRRAPWRPSASPCAACATFRLRHFGAVVGRIHVPGAGTVLHVEGRQHVRVAQRVVDVDRRLLVVAVRVGSASNGVTFGAATRESRFISMPTLVVETGLMSPVLICTGVGAPARISPLGPVLVAGQLGALGIRHVAVLVERELAVAGVLHHARGHGTEETLAVDGDVERVVRGFDIALRELLGDGRDLDADTGRHAAGAVQRTGIHVRQTAPGRP